MPTGNTPFGIIFPISGLIGSTYVQELDGLRAIAVMLVLVLHADPTLQFFPGGFVGVDIFFVLSGYLITNNLLREFINNGRVSLKWFFARRIIRLWPALFVMLLVITLADVTINGHLQARTLKELIVASLHISNWTRAFDVLPMHYFGHTWSLAIEEQFYLLWPPVVVFLWGGKYKVKNLTYIALLTIVLSFIWLALLQSKGASINRMYNGLDTRVMGLLSGAVLSLMRFRSILPVSRSGSTSKVRGRDNFLLACSLLCLSTPFWMRYDANYMYPQGLLFVSIGMCCILQIVLNHHFQRLNVALRFKPLVYLGTISYGLYLWHYPVFQIVRSFGANVLQTFLIGGFVACCIAILSHKLLERPLLEKIKRLQKMTSH